MSNYIIAYHGGRKPESPEEGQAQMGKWKTWVTELGDAVVNPGSPMGAARMVSATDVTDDDGTIAMSGFSVVKAGSLDAAVDMAKACPFLETGGRLRVAELIEMKM